eukprot:298964_1
MYIFYGLILLAIANAEPSCTIYDFPACKNTIDFCLTNNNLNQISGAIYKVKNNCYKALTICSGCLEGCNNNWGGNYCDTIAIGKYPGHLQSVSCTCAPTPSPTTYPTPSPTLSPTSYPAPSPTSYHIISYTSHIISYTLSDTITYIFSYISSYCISTVWYGGNNGTHGSDIIYNGIKHDKIANISWSLSYQCNGMDGMITAFKWNNYETQHGVGTCQSIPGSCPS